jgi:PAS domain S-box-containing protein
MASAATNGVLTDSRGSLAREIEPFVAVIRWCVMTDFTAALGQALLASASDAIVAADREGVIRFWNPGAERIFGHAARDAIGQSLDIIIPERLRKRHWDGFAQVIKTGESRYGAGDLLSVPAITKDRGDISVEFTIVPLHEGDQLVGLVAVMRDVTARFREMREMRRKLAEAAKS